MFFWNVNPAAGEDIDKDKKVRPGNASISYLSATVYCQHDRNNIGSIIRRTPDYLATRKLCSIIG